MFIVCARNLVSLKEIFKLVLRCSLEIFLNFNIKFCFHNTYINLSLHFFLQTKILIVHQQDRDQRREIENRPQKQL